LRQGGWPQIVDKVRRCGKEARGIATFANWTTIQQLWRIILAPNLVSLFRGVANNWFLAAFRQALFLVRVTNSPSGSAADTSAVQRLAAKPSGCVGFERHS